MNEYTWKDHSTFLYKNSHTSFFKRDRGRFKYVRAREGEREREREREKERERERESLQLLQDLQDLLRLS